MKVFSRETAQDWHEVILKNQSLVDVFILAICINSFKKYTTKKFRLQQLHTLRELENYKKIYD